MPQPDSMTLPQALREDIEHAGYLPALVTDVVATAVAGDEIVGHLVHQETTLDEEAVRRHVTVLVLTPQRLVIGHADDHETGEPQGHFATATTETVPLSAVRGVMMTHVLPDPASYTGGLSGRALTLTLGWGTVSRLDLVPAVCADPTCEGDHGYEGTVASDDISLRITAEADGPEALSRAIDFARQLSARLGR
ncbi:phosphodiesterase [Ornithinimicrobium ciconiae]|uniref:Phosphodiesterase n=1 Tax=Ornithinimicrobium ciconiae TaxID=2594265 RepID=A0A516GAA2_9MICO|nr:DUF5998 family protein [Ornithinimicrobium ciconiae]QDO88453.1 phosphodiesterase [Ornithinimicrobium ciconiae]